MTMVVAQDSCRARRSLVPCMGFLLAILLMAGTSACRAPGWGSREDAFVKIEPLSAEYLPEQALIRVHLFGLHETVSSDDPDFPSVGFQYGVDGFTPGTEPDTAAGSEMAAEDFTSWLQEAVRTGAAVVYLAPTFTVKPGREAFAANTKEQSYIENILFDREGNYKTTRKTFTPGARLRVRCQTTETKDVALLSVDMNVSTGQAERHKVAGTSYSKTTGPLTSLELDLVSGTHYRIRTTTPLRFGRSVIVAHRVKQYTDRGFLSAAQRHREHIVCVVTLKRYGTLSDPDASGERVEKTVHFSNTLLWSRPGGDNAARPAGEDPVSDVGTDEVQEAVKAFQRSPDATLFTYGIVTVPGQPVCFEVSDRGEYVSDVGGAPADAQTGPYGIERATVTAGTRFELRTTVSDERVSVNLRGFLAEPWTLRKVEKELLSLRAPVADQIRETYHLTEPIQVMATLREELSGTSDRAVVLKPQWESVAGQENPCRTVIFRQKRLPWPDVQ